MLSNFGLVLFVLSVLVSGGLLIDDGYRAVTGEITITQWTVRKGYRIYALVGAACIGPMGLLLHFLTF